MSFGDNVVLEQKQVTHRSSLGLRILLLIMVTLIALCSLLLCFRVKTITCEGNSIYTDQQLINAAGVSVGENLVTVQKAKAAGRIMTALPFVESVHIERVLPDTIVIHISEASAAFVISDGQDGYFLINSEGILSKHLDSTEAADYPVVTGIILENPELDGSIEECTKNLEGVKAVLALFDALNTYGLTGGVNEINVALLSDISLKYEKRFTVYFGTTKDLTYKVSYLAAMLRDWDDNHAGSIDLTFEMEDNARFQPG